jgi:hypothetical protein
MTCKFFATPRVHFACRDGIYFGRTLAPLVTAKFVAKCESEDAARKLSKLINPCMACFQEAQTGKEHTNHDGCK